MPGIVRAALLGAAALTAVVWIPGGVLIVVNTLRCRRIRRLPGTYNSTTHTEGAP